MLELVPVVVGALAGRGVVLLLAGRPMAQRFPHAADALALAAAALAGVAVSVVSGESAEAFAFVALDALLACSGLVALQVAAAVVRARRRPDYRPSNR